MQRISIALSALISHKQYRLKAACKVTKTDRQITKLRRYWVPDRRACHRESPTAECNPTKIAHLILPAYRKRSPCAYRAEIMRIIMEVLPHSWWDGNLPSNQECGKTSVMVHTISAHSARGPFSRWEGVRYFLVTMWLIPLQTGQQCPSTFPTHPHEVSSLSQWTGWQNDSPSRHTQLWQSDRDVHLSPSLYDVPLWIHDMLESAAHTGRSPSHSQVISRLFSNDCNLSLNGQCGNNVLWQIISLIQ